MKTYPGKQQPPKLGLWLLTRLLSREEYVEKLGDFEEGFALKIAQKGLILSLFWYWFQMVKLVPVLLKNSLYWSFVMLKNYFKVTIRNLRKHKSHTIINLAGLTVGITSCLLILLYTASELSYDNYHPNADQLYRVGVERIYPNSSSLFARTPNPFGPRLAEEFPEVIESTRLYNRGGSLPVLFGDKGFQEDRVFFADPNFFKIFNIKLLRGNRETMLDAPNKVVLTESTARKYFDELDPMGRTIIIGDTTNYVVTGISEDVPQNTHFHFDVLGSYMTQSDYDLDFWLNFITYNYVVLREDAQAGTVEAKLPDFVDRNAGPQITDMIGSYDNFRTAGNGYRYFLQSVKDIHLHSNLSREIEPNGSVTYIYMLLIVAFFILIMASINFMNLSTAVATGRAKEIAMRKVLGSFRKQLINQFLVESIVMSVVALSLAIFLMEGVLPYFNMLTGKELIVDYTANVWLIPVLIGFALFLGILSGSYPAIYLSAFKPITALKGKLAAGVTRSSFRNGLVVVQFTTSFVLIVGTITVINQLRHIQEKRIGFDREQILIIENANIIGAQIESFRQELLTNSNITNAAISDNAPGKLILSAAFRIEDENGVLSQESFRMSQIFTTYDFIETYGIELTDGRSFSRDIITDTLGILINETAARGLGWTDPIGKRIVAPSSDVSPELHVIGVMRDFNFESLHQEVTPFMLRFFNNPNLMSLKVNMHNIQETISFVESQWRAFSSGRPFTYSFLDDDLDAFYHAEREVASLFGTFAGLAISIACLGLLGLTAFTAEQRAKEIGIRKVLGATATGIVLLLSKDFTKLIAIACLIGAPIGYYFMNSWLQNFAYRIEFSVSIVMGAAVLLFLTAVFTTCFYSLKSAFVNPVRSLRAE